MSEIGEYGVRVVKKMVKGSYEGFTVTIPKKIAEAYGIKGGEILHVRLIETEVNGRKIKGILYYKP